MVASGGSNRIARTAGDGRLRVAFTRSEASWYAAVRCDGVPMPGVAKVTLPGSALAMAMNSCNAFAGEVAGSGGLDLASVEVQSLKLSIGGSGDVKTGAGHAKAAQYDIAGSGGIDAAAITAEQAKVSIAGSGSVKVNATGTAEVDVMGSGDVNVMGGAKCTITKAGSGDVRCS